MAKSNGGDYHSIDAREARGDDRTYNYHPAEDEPDPASVAVPEDSVEEEEEDEDGEGVNNVVNETHPVVEDDDTLVLDANAAIVEQPGSLNLSAPPGNLNAHSNRDTMSAGSRHRNGNRRERDGSDSDCSESGDRRGNRDRVRDRDRSNLDRGEGDDERVREDARRVHGPRLNLDRSAAPPTPAPSVPAPSPQAPDDPAAEPPAMNDGDEDDDNDISPMNTELHAVENTVIVGDPNAPNVD